MSLIFVKSCLLYFSLMVHVLCVLSGDLCLTRVGPPVFSSMCFIILALIFGLCPFLTVCPFHYWNNT